MPKRRTAKKASLVNQHGERVGQLYELLSDLHESLEAGSKTKAEAIVEDLVLAVRALRQALYRPIEEYEPYEERTARRADDMTILFQSHAERFPGEWLRVDHAKALLGWPDVADASYADIFKTVASTLPLEHNGKKSRASAYRWPNKL